MLNGKAMIVYLTVRFIKEIFLYKTSYVPEQNNCNKNKINMTKSELKGIKEVDLSKFDLANLKSDANDLDIDKLKTVSVDLSKLSNVVKK